MRYETVGTLTFVAITLALVAFSWRSLRSLRVHGFYRFFGFEFLAAVIMLNLPLWISDPLSVRQCASWLFGLTSIGMAYEGFRLLRMVGRPVAECSTKTNLAFENTTRLVTVGAYRWIRHPLYTSLISLALCAYLKNPSSLASQCLTAGAVFFFFATAFIEEKENLARFGAGYADYMSRTHRFVPFLF